MANKYCSNCGAEMKNGKCINCNEKKKKETKENVETKEYIKENNTPALLGFIFSLTICLYFPGFILSIIGLATAKNYKNNRKGFAITGLIISSILLLLTIFSIFNDSPTQTGVQIPSPTQPVKLEKITVTDFSVLSKVDAEKWCTDKGIYCNITEDYSDAVSAGKLISQSVEKNTKVEKGSEIKIVYSKGHQKSAAEIESEFKAQCKELDYRDALRNPANHGSEKVHIFGKVSQVVGKSNYMVYVNCSENQYATGGYICDDPIYINYYGTSNLIEDDIVEIWGTMNSKAYTYTTVLGASKTVPQLDAYYSIIR